MLQHLRQCIANKLKNVIEAHNLPLGTTGSGKDWCIKALHPSDPLTEVRGIPDQSCVPSVFVNYQTVAEITNPNPAAVGTWSTDIALIPHPIGFLYHKDTDSVGTAQGCVLNSQLTGATHKLKYAALREFAERWRLAYMSVTIYQDGADLTNQGTFVACQSVVKPCEYQGGFVREPVAGNQCLFTCKILNFLAEDEPDYSKAQSMPNAYFNRSKEGCYMPLKLTETHQRWHSAGKPICVTVGSFDADTQALVLPTATSVAVYPFPGLEQFWFDPTDVLYPFGGEATSPFCNDTWGFICGKNLALTTKLQVYIRAGYEFQVQPGSLMSPHQVLSPPQDEVALRTYFAITRELKDAHPAEFNDLGKIWDVISGIAKTVAPAIAAVPGIGMPLSAAITGVSTVGDVIRRAVAGSVGGQKGGSAADRELAQAVVKAQSNVAPQYRVRTKASRKRAARRRGVKQASAAPAVKVPGAFNIMRRK